MRMQRLL
ncbi:hypothetical protein D018_4517A, partial [Vibrio parahaemolyticus VP2007-007]